MYKKQLIITLLIALGAVLQATAANKPLKVYILAGQSNMQGQAQLSTVPRMALSPETKALHDKMVDENGKPRVHKNVSIIYFTGGDVKNGEERPQKVRQGQLAAGVVGAIGPDIAFGITMGEAADDPILIIKAAWGGRDLRQQFRPPSAGPFAKDKDRFGNPTGHYYNRILQCVKEVLADPGKYHKGYDKAAGYEIAGFVWFQGYNDAIASRDELYKATKDKPQFAAYTDLQACLIRDLRKEFNVPKMPCVIGVMGTGGGGESPFRKAQAATAAMPEFKGNVVAVPTAQFWDKEVQDATQKVAEAKTLWKTSEHWTVVGTTAPQDRIWHYTSFELAPEKLYLNVGTGFGANRDFTDETPAELKDWLNPAFDTTAWQKGPAPIGKGTEPKPRRKKGQPEVKQPKLVRSPWGDGNMLLMKTTFTHERDDISHFRLCLRSSRSFYVYLNGQRIRSYPWWQGTHIRRWDIDAKFVKKGKNELAFYGNIEDHKGRFFNAVDLYLEGLSKEHAGEIKKQQNDIAPPRIHELAKGKSNQGFHYLGSAYTYSRIGEAMAKAMMSLKP